MAERSRKRWLQLHLSTAIVMMFAAGGFIGLNTIEHPQIVRESAPTDAYEETSEQLVGDRIYLRYGWPHIAASRLVGTDNSGVVERYSITNPLRFNAGGVMADAAGGLLLLLVVWLVFETWIAIGRG